MRVVYFTNTWRPQRGGVSTSIWLFTAELRRRGHRIFIVAPEYEEPFDDPPWVFRVPAIKRFRGSSFSVPYPQILNFRLLSGVRRLRPDVVHVHHPFLLGELGLRVARKLGVPCVFTYHTLYHKYTHYLFPDSVALQRVAIFGSIFFSNLCDAVVAPSVSVRDFLREEGVRTEINVIPTGVEDDFISNSVPNHGFKSGFHLVFVGRLEREKNLEFLVKAVSGIMREERGVFLRVIGDGRERRNLENLVRELGVADRVDFTGELDRDTLKATLSRCHAFVFASTTETQGLVLLEAMARGLPVVAVRGPGVVDVVEDGVNGFLCGENEEEFRGRVMALMRSPLLHRKMSAAALQTARDYSMSTMADRLESLYRYVVVGGRRGKRGVGRWSVEMLSSIFEGKRVGNSVGERGKPSLRFDEELLDVEPVRGVYFQGNSELLFKHFEVFPLFTHQFFGYVGVNR